MEIPVSGSDPSYATSGERFLQDQLGTRERANRFYGQQMLDHLNEPMRHFIARQNMMFLATSDARGACDSTLRAGPPGFVVALDAHRLAWPEYRGNGVMASRGNIIENPHVGLLFVDFVHDVVGLHVNGSATLTEDALLRQQHRHLPADPVPGRRAEQWIVAIVEEAYIHCSKHIPVLHQPPRERRHSTHRSQPKKSDFFAVKATGAGRQRMARPPACQHPEVVTQPEVVAAPVASFSHDVPGYTMVASAYPTIAVDRDPGRADPVATCATMTTHATRSGGLGTRWPRQLRRVLWRKP